MPTKILDDRDAAAIYSSGWGRAGSAPQEYNGTTRFASSPGLTATLTFQGTMVAVYGTIAAAGSSSTIPPQTSYSVDGGDVVTYTETMTRSVQYRQLFYQSPQLSDGQHTLVITNLIQASGFFVDYFVVTTGSGDTTAPTTTTTISTATTTSLVVHSGGNISTGSGRETASSSGSTGRSSSNSAGCSTASLAPSGSVTLDVANGDGGGVNHTGTIVGGTIGAIGCLILLAAIILVLRRRDGKAHGKKAPSSSFVDDPGYYHSGGTNGMSYANFQVHSVTTQGTSTTSSDYLIRSNTVQDTTVTVAASNNNQQTHSNPDDDDRRRPPSPPAYVSSIHPPTYVHDVQGQGNNNNNNNPYGLDHPRNRLPSKLQNEYPH